MLSGPIFSASRREGAAFEIRDRAAASYYRASHPQLLTGLPSTSLGMVKLVNTALFAVEGDASAAVGMSVATAATAATTSSRSLEVEERAISTKFDSGREAQFVLGTR